jgi:hypothetical protein
MVMVGDGGEKMSGTNMNYLLEEFGMSLVFYDQFTTYFFLSKEV